MFVSWLFSRFSFLAFGYRRCPSNFYMVPYVSHALCAPTDIPDFISFPFLVKRVYTFPSSPVSPSPSCRLTVHIHCPDPIYHRVHLEDIPMDLTTIELLSVPIWPFQLLLKCETDRTTPPARRFPLMFTADQQQIPLDSVWSWGDRARRLAVVG